MAHMASIPNVADLAALSVAYRLDLMDQIWESLKPIVDALPLPELHRTVNEHRLRALEADGNLGRPAEEVLLELKSRL
ncbi:MAG: addiction module protein [Proteobacteria bacterium]|nr:addiction module protein [Pseudomonadota bacterium]